ncbi:hypothetical protein GCM10009745_33670 [Kribbella yunnanensis]|uniref:Uncharacterized protein n=1 Tax=Kribbella yunnanensis TaxID=190194 RepID=A0ABP4TE73_9ACTN
MRNKATASPFLHRLIVQISPCHNPVNERTVPSQRYRLCTWEWEADD